MLKLLFTGLVLNLGAIGCAAGNQSSLSSASRNRTAVQHSDAYYSRVAGEQVHRIGGVQLRQFIPGATISRRRPPAGEGHVDVSVSSYDVFGRDGSYFRGVENSRAAGTYVISGDRVCSRTTSLTRCRLFFRGLSGFYLVYVDAPDSVIPVSFTY